MRERVLLMKRLPLPASGLSSALSPQSHLQRLLIQHGFGKQRLQADVLIGLMKTLLTSECVNQRGAGHPTKKRKGTLVGINRRTMYKKRWAPMLTHVLQSSGGWKNHHLKHPSTPEV